MILLAPLAGCGTTRFDWLKKNPESSGPPRDVPPVARLVDYLNDNAGRVQALRYEDISLTVHQTGSKGLPITVTAQMAVEKPLNFRMKAKGPLGGDVADIGSNAQEFWWWNKNDPRPAQYYCSYADLKEGRARDLNLPVQPEWLIEAIGLGPYGPVEKYKVESDAETVKLIERTQTPSGRTVRKVIVFQRRPKTPPYAMVSDFLLLDDATGRELCSMHVKEVHAPTPATRNAVLPRKIELNSPDMKVRLTLQMDRLSVSAREPLVPATAFVRQPMTNVMSINIADSRQVGLIQQVEGPGPR